jgi:RimK family alpha-L-glutamate ligase
MNLSIFLEEISLQYLFIGFSADGKEQALKKELKGPVFASWKELTLENGVVLARGIPLDKFKFVLIGAIHDNTDMYACIQAYLKANKIKSLSYGSPPEIENKLFQTTVMQVNKIAQIETVIARADQVTAAQLIKKLKLPIVSKIIDGSQGKGIEKHEKKADLEKFLKKGFEEMFIFQEFVPNEGDYRAFYLKDKLIYVIKRTSQDKKEFRHNVSLGGKQEYTELPAEAKQLSDQVRRAMGFDVTGVDLIQNSKTGKWYVMEINAAPQFTGPEFKKVIDALVTLIKE